MLRELVEPLGLALLAVSPYLLWWGVVKLIDRDWRRR